LTAIHADLSHGAGADVRRGEVTVPDRAAAVKHPRAGHTATIRQYWYFPDFFG